MTTVREAKLMDKWAAEDAAADLVDLSPADPYLADLREDRATVRELESRIQDAAHRAREHGATWQQIADELGTTKQAAQQRYGKP